MFNVCMSYLIVLAVDYVLKKLHGNISTNKQYLVQEKAEYIYILHQNTTFRQALFNTGINIH